jgi:hypothetical protein
MSGENPFAGEFPTLDEIHAVLDEHGFGEDKEVYVTPPMGGEPVPLDEGLTTCRSKDLMMGYPHGFKSVVKNLIKQAGGE